MNKIERHVIDTYLDEMEAAGDVFQGVILIGMGSDGQVVGVNPVDTDDLDLVIASAKEFVQRWEKL